MLIELNGFLCQGNIGNKAKSIIDLNRYGFKVPTSVALPSDIYNNAILEIKDKISMLIDRLSIDNIEVISKQIGMLFDKVVLPDDICLEIIDSLHKDNNYLLRTSIDGVDEKYSFSGLYPVRNNINKSNIIENILDCYKSLYSYNSLYYIVKNDIDISNMSTAIIIQREVKTDITGSVSTMNPVSLNTTEIYISINNKKKYENYIFDYMANAFIKEDEYIILDKNRIYETIELIKSVQQNIGCPVDIDLAFTRNDIYIMQTRPINNIIYDNKDGIWRKKKMSPKMFMYSLVNNSYIDVIRDYYSNFKIKEVYNPVSLEFNTCYYNVQDISNIIDSVVDYDNNYFYKNLNMDTFIERTNTLKKRLRRRKNKKILQKKIDYYTEEFDDFKVVYNDLYNEYCNTMINLNAKDVEKKWNKLVFTDYTTLYKLYTDLKILVLIQKNNLYKELSPYIEQNEFNEVIVIKEENARYKINKIFNNLINKIKVDEESYRYWFSSSTLKILKDYNNESKEFYHPEFRNFISNYGYQSFFKFDLSESFYVEDVEDVIREVKKQLANFEVIQDNEMERNEIFEKMKEEMMDKTYEVLSDKIQELQVLIVNLSELRDLIYKYNFIVKRFSKSLAKLYISKNVLDNESDIWYLNINSIYDFSEGEISPEELRKKMLLNKLFFKSFRNFLPTENIGFIHTYLDNPNYKGIGLSTDIVSGRVRNIKSLKELETLTYEDILVTKTININLLFQLPQIRGIIISDYNISNAVKNILRELSIPCIVLEGSGKKLIDNSYITMDGSTGDIVFK